MKPTLCYARHVTDKTLRKLLYGHYDWMTFVTVIILEEINARCKPILFTFITSKFTVLLPKHK